MPTAPLTRRLPLPERFDLPGTLGQLTMSRFDPTSRWIDGSYWMAARTPDGPGSLRLHRDGATLTAHGYGPGADWLVEHADAMAGLRDDLTGFHDLIRDHPLLARLAREHAGLRLPATGMVFPRLLRAVCEQKVTGKEAHHSYGGIVRHLAEPAPGPVDGLLLPPDPAMLAAAAYYEYHRFGLEQRRANTLRGAAAAAPSLARCPDSGRLTARLLSLPGIGPWTAAEVVATVFGDPDAVSVGDYHIPNMVSWALAGEPRGDDARMLELLAPYAGHRGRVIVLLEAGGMGAPRFGPRASVRTHI